MSQFPLPPRARLFRERLESRLQKTPPTEEEITPHSGWTQEPNLHSLLVELPGFKEADIKLRIEAPGSIAVSGERLITAQNKRARFNKAFKVPEDSDIENITMKFQGDVLKVSIPRVVKEKKLEPELKTNEEALVGDSKEEEKKEERKIKTEEAILSDPKEEPKIKTDEPLISNSMKDNKEEPKIKADEAVVSDSEEEEKEKTEIKTDEALVKDSKEEPEKIPSIEEKAQKTREDEQEEIHRDGKEETSQMSVIGKISQNKGILLASILSFTLGFLLSKRYQPLPPK